MSRWHSIHFRDMESMLDLDTYLDLYTVIYKQMVYIS